MEYIFHNKCQFCKCKNPDHTMLCWYFNGFDYETENEDGGPVENATKVQCYRCKGSMELTPGTPWPCKCRACRWYWRN